MIVNRVIYLNMDNTEQEVLISSPKEGAQVKMWLDNFSHN